jgi:hypothetical protein
MPQPDFIRGRLRYDLNITGFPRPRELLALSASMRRVFRVFGLVSLQSTTLRSVPCPPDRSITITIIDDWAAACAPNRICIRGKFSLE